MHYCPLISKSHGNQSNDTTWYSDNRTGHRSALIGYLTTTTVSFNTQEAREPTRPDWALDTAKRGASLSDAQRTTAASSHLICKAWRHSAPTASFCHFHVQAPFVCPLRRQGGGTKGGNHVSRRLFCNLRASIHVDSLQKKQLHTHSTNPLSPHTHLSPRLTNVPWHSYITRKLAKWINHGPCLALRVLNGFSPLQVCPIIAFIHLVEARFTHSLRSRQSPDTFSALVARAWEICHRIITGNSNNN